MKTKQYVSAPLRVPTVLEAVALRARLRGMSEEQAARELGGNGYEHWLSEKARKRRPATA